MFVPPPEIWRPVRHRLVDDVVAATETIVASDGKRRHRLPGVGYQRREITRCGARYLLDDAATRACLDLMFTHADAIDCADPLLRVPAERFWIEWVSNPPFAEAEDVYTGLFVSAAPDGRSGSLTGYCRSPISAASSVVAEVIFDLDRPPCQRFAIAERRTLHRMRQATLPQLQDVLDRAVLRVDPRWAGYLRGCGRLQSEQMSLYAELVWPYLPFLLAFSHLLASRRLAAGAAGRTRFMAPQHSSARRALDHIEVRLDLAGGAGGAGGGSALARTAARQHQVRGHLVSRNGKIFWRKAHVRGDRSRAMRSRNVAVTWSAQS